MVESIHIHMPDHWFSGKSKFGVTNYVPELIMSHSECWLSKKEMCGREVIASMSLLYYIIILATNFILMHAWNMHTSHVL